eukprot:TRINITY_DN63645_c0_g1_i1.p1 TRINITY_DN63645_c0_g1~~TRINITY_DN63645_c0_g1_i1.p1  ORF type:complete len:239 (+),score=21.15 TRINITY_DN63645_c0_g1_i1:57-773(+)
MAAFVSGVSPIQPLAQPLQAHRATPALAVGAALRGSTFCSLLSVGQPAVPFALVAACIQRRGRQRRRAHTSDSAPQAELASPQEVVRQAGLKGPGSLPGGEVVKALEKLEDDVTDASQGNRARDESSLVEGRYELVFSSALLGVPFIDGFMPTKEILEFSFAPARRMSIRVETLPFLPSIDIVGDDCAFDPASRTISYRIRGKAETSRWSVIYVDEDVLAARSSVTGLNIAKRLTFTS